MIKNPPQSGFFIAPLRFCRRLAALTAIAGITGAVVSNLQPGGFVGAVDMISGCHPVWVIQRSNTQADKFGMVETAITQAGATIRTKAAADLGRRGIFPHGFPLPSELLQPEVHPTAHHSPCALTALTAVTVVGIERFTLEPITYGAAQAASL